MSGVKVDELCTALRVASVASVDLELTLGLSRVEMHELSWLRCMSCASCFHLILFFRDPEWPLWVTTCDPGLNNKASADHLSRKETWSARVGARKTNNCKTYEDLDESFPFPSNKSGRSGLKCRVWPGEGGFRQIITNLFSRQRLEWLHPAAPLYSRPIRASATAGQVKGGEEVVRRVWGWGEVGQLCHQELVFSL